MHFDGKDLVLTTKEATDYLKISESTLIKYIRLERIKAIKTGKEWRVPQSELYRFLKGEGRR
jgi:excisionase family DNA binding protein